MLDLNGKELSLGGKVLVKTSHGFNGSQIAKGVVMGFTPKMVKVAYYDEYEGTTVQKNLKYVVSVGKHDDDTINDMVHAVNLLLC